MLGMHGRGAGCPGITTAQAAADGDRRGPVRAARAAGAALALAAVGMGLAAGAAQATTFPGTNGRVAGSGPLNTDPLNTGSKLEVFTMKSAFSDPSGDPAPPDECRLTFNENSDFNPRFSQNGKMIAFVRDNQIYTMKLDANGRCAATEANGNPLPPTQVTFATTATGSPAQSFVGGWSPTDANGKAWIVFQSSRDGNFEVYKIQVDGNGAPVANTETRLTNNAANDSQPAWRPDGAKIAFHSNRDGNSNIHVMDADGNGVATLPDNSPAEESAPAYSPDGTQVAFQTNRDTVTGQPRNYEIYRMNVDGTGDAKRLSYSGPSGGPLGAALTDLTAYDLFPAWSPDGSRICFHSGRAEENRHSGFPTVIAQWELYTLDAVDGESTGTATERLTNRAANDERCAWGVAVP